MSEQEYNEAVRKLGKYCQSIPSDYKKTSWFGKIFFAIETIQKQLDDGIPDVQLIISSAELIKNQTTNPIGTATPFRHMFGKIPKEEGNILDVIDIIEKHYRPIFNAMKPAPRKQDFEIRPMTSLLDQLRQCA